MSIFLACVLSFFFFFFLTGRIVFYCVRLKRFYCIACRSRLYPGFQLQNWFLVNKALFWFQVSRSHSLICICTRGTLILHTVFLQLLRSHLHSLNSSHSHMHAQNLQGVRRRESSPRRAQGREGPSLSAEYALLLPRTHVILASLIHLRFPQSDYPIPNLIIVSPRARTFLNTALMFFV